MSVTVLHPRRSDVEISEIGIEFPVGTSYEQWAKTAAEVQRQHRGLMWALADTFMYGEDHFGEEEKYANAIESYSIDTIQAAVRVGRHFPRLRRRPIGFSFHQAVLQRHRQGGDFLLTVEEQDSLLDRATAQAWTREAMRQHMAEVREERTKPPRQDPADEPPLPLMGGSGEKPEPARVATPDGRVLDDQRGQEDQSEDEPAPPTDNMSHPEENIHVLPALPRASNTDDAAAMLRSLVTTGVLPNGIGHAISLVLDEREKLRELANAARSAVSMRYITARLSESVEMLWPS